MAFRFLKKIVNIFLAVLVSEVGFTLTQSQVGSELPFSRILDKDSGGRYRLSWSYNTSHIMFEVQVNATGYVGFGLSPVGRMYPADIVIAWVHNDQVYLGDYHTKDTRNPVIDEKQDWHMMYGFEVDGATTVAFIRLLDTCDVNDVVITTDTMQVIYSYHDDDPDAVTGMVPYHGQGRRGALPMLFMAGSLPPESISPNDTFLIDFTNSMYPIPPTDVSRICIVFNMSGIFPTSHIIKYEPQITPGNEPYLLRMTIHRCHMNVTGLSDIDGKVYDCQVNAPNPVRTCRSVVVTWSKGGEPVHLEDAYGISLGAADDPAMYVLELHYTNTLRLTNVMDSSGVRLTYTPNLRPHDAAFLELGTLITTGWQQIVPPGEESFQTDAACSERCMDWGFASENITIYATGVLFNGAPVTKSIRLRHLRKDDIRTYELPWIADDDKFSANYQPMRMLRVPIAIERSDLLLLECTYNTVGRYNVTKGGWSENDAMCRASLLYYPRVPLEMCLSWTSLDQLKSQLGHSVPENMAVRYLSSVTDWSNNPIMKRHLHFALENSSQRSLCTAQSRNPAYAVDRFQRPIASNVYREPVRVCNTGR